jgi:hypothetical protein
MTILLEVNNLIEEANIVAGMATNVAKPVAGGIAKTTNNVVKGVGNMAKGIGKTWGKLSPLTKIAAVGAGGLGLAGAGLAAGHTLGAAAFAPAANFLHIAPASGALSALNPKTAPATLAAAIQARRAIQSHYNG